MKKFALASTALAALFASSSSFAASYIGDIVFTGQVVADTCRVTGSGHDATHINVDLGSYATVDVPSFSGLAASSVKKTISFKVQCPTTQAVSIKLQGTGTMKAAASVSNAVLQAAGTATGVGIVMLKSDGNPYNLTTDYLLGGAAGGQSVPAGPANAVDVSFGAAMIKYDDATTPTVGTVEGTVKYKLEYL